MPKAQRAHTPSVPALPAAHGAHTAPCLGHEDVGTGAEPAAQVWQLTRSLRGTFPGAQREQMPSLPASLWTNFRRLSILPWLKAALNRTCRSDGVTRDSPAALSVGAAQAEVQKIRKGCWAGRAAAHPLPPHPDFAQALAYFKVFDIGPSFTHKTM